MDTDRIPRERRYVFASKTKSIEWKLTALMCAWGTALLMPGNTFSMLPYREFVRLGLDETDVSAFFLTMAGLRAWTLYMNGALALGPEVRLFCSLVGVLTWSFIAYLFAMPTISLGVSMAPLPVNSLEHIVFFGAEAYAIGVAAFDRARRS